MNIDKINIRRATIEDVDDILAVEKSLDGNKIYSAMIDKNEIIEEVKKDYFYIIELDKEIVGDMSYEIKDKSHAYMSGLAVSPKFQGRGIARQAIKAILEKLKDIKVIELATHPDNEKAIHLYESFGFKKTGEIKENYFGDGESRILMVLEK